MIALTFDAGPYATSFRFTGKARARATFFVVGEHAKKFPNLILRQENKGHEIANHTYPHPYSSTPKELDKELKMTDDVIFDITGTYP